MTGPGRHQVWPHAIERRAVALRQLGRVQESLQLGRDALRFGEDEDLEPVNMLRLYVAVALSEAQAGLLDDAAGHIDAALRCAEREGVAGVPLGVVYEAQARIAIRNRDAAAFAMASARCADCLLAGNNPALTAKHNRLLQEARMAGVSQGPLVHTDEHDDSAAHPVVKRLAAVSDRTARADLVLESLATHYRAHSACLFGVTAHGLELLASLGSSICDDNLRAKVNAYLAAELTETEVVTVTRHDELAAQGNAHVWTTDTGATYLPVLLRARRQSEELIAGVAVLQVESALRLSPEPSYLDAMGQALLHGVRNSGVPAAR